jgi:hypothetical protein
VSSALSKIPAGDHQTACDADREQGCGCVRDRIRSGCTDRRSGNRGRCGTKESTTIGSHQQAFPFRMLMLSKDLLDEPPLAKHAGSAAHDPKQESNLGPPILFPFPSQHRDDVGRNPEAERFQEFIPIAEEQPTESEIDREIGDDQSDPTDFIHEFLSEEPFATV